MPIANVYQGSIAIVGGGLTGVTLAVALLHRGISATIYEQAAEFGEIGQGVAFSVAAIRAMEVCSPDLVTAFQKSRMVNPDPAKRDVFFNWHDGMSDTKPGESKHWFTTFQECGLGACHRAHFLAEAVKLIPEGMTRFSKRLETIEELDQKVKLKFQDGTEAIHDALVAADGIKSAVRRWMLGSHPASLPRYTHEYAYRGLIPVAKLVQPLGDDFGKDSIIYLGRDGHMITFPINHGELLCVVAFSQDANKDWPDITRMVRPSSREEVRKDFAHFGATAQCIIDHLDPDIDCWAIFDVLGVPHYNKGRVLLTGDAAHAAGSHLAGGAGIGTEDCAILAQLLADPSVVRGERGIEAVFQAFNDQRMERTQWFVKTSRYAGEIYELRSPLGADADRIREEVERLFGMVWDGQIKEYILEAKALLASGV